MPKEGQETKKLFEEVLAENFQTGWKLKLQKLNKLQEQQTRIKLHHHVIIELPETNDKEKNLKKKPVEKDTFGREEQR